MVFGTRRVAHPRAPHQPLGEKFCACAFRIKRTNFRRSAEAGEKGESKKSKQKVNTKVVLR
jgi:hypothetical protein